MNLHKKKVIYHETYNLIKVGVKFVERKINSTS